ncbi:alpha beta hydrolase fold-3 domain-containing protein [Macrophomina phaseolina]|uniref:Alpha beta hydrolase fold-3 domain-containing protein n=1 Tax=Macrophomina phaseolina TaxID=35725 RepID=A0ABQ8GCU9_9PEZI|nr:alpha beta hydrolase fold-3 domain-containing protein [Macrophomina phaseolina]
MNTCPTSASREWGRAGYLFGGAVFHTESLVSKTPAVYLQARRPHQRSRETIASFRVQPTVVMTEPINPIPSKYLDKLDPQFIEVYNTHAAFRIRADQASIEEVRANPTKYQATVPPGPTPPVASATIHKIAVNNPPGEIEAKVYIPTSESICAGGLQNAEGKLPAYVNYHGGGWVLGSLQTDAPLCHQTTHSLGAITIDVNYRHGPETPFPAAIHDALGALAWVFAHADALGIDAARVAVGGLSAGGHLAAVVAHLARDEPSLPPLRLQCLVVPCVDMRWTPVGDEEEEEVCAGVEEGALPYAAYAELVDVPCLPLQRIRWFFRHWVGTGEDRKEKVRQPIASPILFPSHAGIAPASIHVAEFDILRDEAEAYHEALKAAGTRSEFHIYKGMCHPFAMWDGALDKGKECNRNRIEALRAAFKL